MTDITTIEIKPLGVYSTDELSAMLDVGWDKLGKARHSGALRSTKKGRRVLYLGEWVLDWLRAEDLAEEVSGGSD
jgi:hypothetical protein